MAATVTHAERKHARFAPSAAHRWVNCPGSVSLVEQFPNKSTPAADEGTAAHQIAERCLNKGWDAADHYTTDNTIPVRKGVEIKVTEDMIEGVQLYLDYVRGIFDQCDEFAIEARLDMSHIHPEFFGTGDAIGFDQRSGTVHVVDFKFGRKPVDPVENWQGISYAIGAMSKWIGRGVNKVLVHIVQPRVSRGAVTWEVDLLVSPHIAKIKGAIAGALVRRPAFAAGDWCEYCPAAAVCPTLKDRALEIARDEFGDLKQVETLDREALGALLSEIDIIEGWCKQVRSFSLEEATQGRPPAGHKLVAKRAVRKWKYPETVGSALIEMFGMADEEIFDRKIKSPAQMEKWLPKAERNAMADLVTKVSSGVTLAPESDKRPAISPDAAQEFSKVEIEDD